MSDGKSTKRSCSVIKVDKRDHLLFFSIISHFCIFHVRNVAKILSICIAKVGLELVDVLLCDPIFAAYRYAVASN